jgi:hypothetical protein
MYPYSLTPLIMYTLRYMYYNYYNRKENNVVVSIQPANGVFILAQIGY